MIPVMRIIVATGNVHKLEEYRKFLSQLNFEVVSSDELLSAKDAAQFSLPGIQPNFRPAEISSEYSENACVKARSAADQHNGFAIADDTGLEIDYLEGAPGIRTARFARGDFERAKLDILMLMRGVSGNRRSARFRCVVAIAGPAIRTRTFEGVCEGFIIQEAVREGGFGYDALFLPVGSVKTLDQLSADERLSIGHRGRALRAAEPFLRSLQRRMKSVDQRGG
jgi:XTP/dITP diphosphohydrolase